MIIIVDSFVSEFLWEYDESVFWQFVDGVKILNATTDRGTYVDSNYCPPILHAHLTFRCISVCDQCC